MSDAKIKILGLSFFYHDAAAALVIDGQPVAMAEEERFSRKKHDSYFPTKAVEFVLEEAKIQDSALDYVVFYEKPFVKFERIMKTNLATFPWAPKVFRESLKQLFLEKLWIRELIAKKLNIDPDKVLFTEHHISHAASAFYCSPFEKSATLTIDGVGEWATTTIGTGEGNNLSILREIHFPHSLGLLYSAFTAFLGFEVNEGEYKVMGMAPYGSPKYVDKVQQLLHWHDDDSYELDLSYFSFHRSMTDSFSGKFVKLFGPPRDSKSKFFTRASGWPAYFGAKPHAEEYEKMALEQEYFADIAASIQAVMEQAIVRLAKRARLLTGCDKLCYAGGVALNSSANGKILKEAGFVDIFIQPAAGDAGGALGAALFVDHAILQQPRNFVMKHAYFGKDYSPEIKGFLDSNGIHAEHFADEEKLVEYVANQIAAGKVVGWFQGKFEWGPRALGNRSILADPRKVEMKDIVNTKIKFREPYRPFAPSIMAEHASEYFDISNPEAHIPAYFMLYVVQVKPEKRAEIPAVTHVDGSARIQVVRKEENARYWRLIKSFYEKTGVPILLNTSFNLKGEPVVSSPGDAFKTFSRCGMDILVLGNYVITK